MISLNWHSGSAQRKMCVFKDSVLLRKTSCASGERLASLVFRLRRTLAPSALVAYFSRTVLNRVFDKDYEWVCIVAPVNTYLIHTHTPPSHPTTSPTHTSTHAHPNPYTHTPPHTLITAFFKHTLHITEWLDTSQFWRENGGHFLFIQIIRPKDETYLWKVLK